MLFWSTEILCASGMTGGAVRSTDLRENPVFPSAAERPRDRRFCGTLNAVRPVTDEFHPAEFMPAAGELRTGQRQHAPFGIGTATGDAFGGYRSAHAKRPHKH